MKLKVLLFTLALVLAFSAGAFAASGINLVVNGTAVTNVEAKVIDGSTYVPLRAVSTMLGAEVGWDSKTKTASVNLGTKATAKGYDVRDVTFYDVTVEEGTFGWDLATEVKNNGTKTIQGMNFTATFYDEDGNRIGTAMGNVSDLRTGEFKTSTMVTSDDLTGYKTIKFQIDMSY
jgi:hypothetical protein